MSVQIILSGIALSLAQAAPAFGSSAVQECGAGAALMTDLGFRPLNGSVNVDSSGEAIFRFLDEPRITAVRADGPAAGRVAEGDILVAIEGYPITTPEGARLYSRIRPGDRLKYTVRHAGELRKVTITAVGRCIPHPPAPPPPPPAPPAPAAPAAPIPPNPAPDELMPSAWLGFLVECRNCGKDPRTGVLRFLEPPVVSNVTAGSQAARAGIRAGDRLTHLNELSLTDPIGWARFYAIQPGDNVRLTFARGDELREVTITAAHQL